MFNVGLRRAVSSVRWRSGVSHDCTRAGGCLFGALLKRLFTRSARTHTHASLARPHSTCQCVASARDQVADDETRGCLELSWSLNLCRDANEISQVAGSRRDKTNNLTSGQLAGGDCLIVCVLQRAARHRPRASLTPIASELVVRGRMEPPARSVALIRQFGPRLLRAVSCGPLERADGGRNQAVARSPVSSGRPEARARARARRLG